MRERLLGRYGGELLAGSSSERAPGGGDDETIDLVMADARYRLGDRGVLGVHRGGSARERRHA